MLHTEQEIEPWYTDLGLAGNFCCVGGFIWFRAATLYSSVDFHAEVALG